MKDKSTYFCTEQASFGASLPKKKPKEKIEILKIEILVNDRFVPIPLPQPKEEIRMQDQVVEVKKSATTWKKSTEELLLEAADEMAIDDVYDYKVKEDDKFGIDMALKQQDVRANIVRNGELDRHIHSSPPNAQTEGKPAQLKRICSEIEIESAKKKKKPVDSEPAQQKHANKKEEGKPPTTEKSKAEFLKSLQQKADAHIVVNSGKPNERKIPVITVPEGFGLGPGDVSVVSYDLDGRALEETSRTLVEALELDEEEVKDVKLVKRNTNARTVEDDSGSEKEKEEKDSSAEKEQKDSSEKKESAKETQPEENRKKWGTAPLNETPSCNILEFLEAMYKRKKAELVELKQNIELARILAAMKAESSK